MYHAFAFAAILFVTVKGQLQNQLVNVGIQGSFYSPGTTSASENTVVTFEFFGFSHSVTQSSADDPCNPLPNGFHSGYYGTGTNNSGPVMAWNLMITNVSAPIWYFCAVGRPVFHCSVGMVGVINPPSQDAYNTFMINAKSVTTTASIGATPILTGIGAFASSTPTTTVLAVTVTPSSTSSSSTPTPSSTSSSSPSPTTAPVQVVTPNLGVIVGGTVGGAIAIITFMFALWYFCLRNKQQPPAAVQNDDFFRYNSVSARRLPTEGFGDTIASSNPASSLTPLRLSPVIQATHPHRHWQLPVPAQQSDIDSTSLNPTNTTGQPNNVDIRALAQEVAAVLYQNPDGASLHRSPWTDGRTES